MNLDQVRAANAFGFVRTVADGQDRFLALSRKLPVMLQTNGLLATWAHLLAKKGREYERIVEALLRHLQHQGIGLVEGPTSAEAVFLEVWTVAGGATGGRLRRLTAEAIAYSVWLKRAAEALCDRGQAPAPVEEDT